MSSNTQYELELPPYEVCVKTSYTKENIEEFKIQLQNIEDELLNIKSNDIRKPQLRREAADLEEIIINFENTKPIPEIVQSLNDNIELLNEYVELEKNNILDNNIINQLNAKIFTDDINWPIRTPQDFNNKIISKNDIEIFINHLKFRFPKYSTAIEIHCEHSVHKVFSLSNGNHNYSNILTTFKSIVSEQRINAINRRTEIKTYIDETQLSFNKKLSSFIENIIDEKKQMEDKIIELENKVNKLIRLVQYKRAEDESNFENLD
jgi:hypothetical protein